jgi:fructokinase
VDISALQWDHQRPTRIVLVRRDAQGERSFGGFAGDQGAGFADQALDAAELETRLDPWLLGTGHSMPAWLLTGTIPLASALSAEALELLLDRGRSAGLSLALDVNWRPTFWDRNLASDAAPPAAVQERLRPLLARADLLKCAAEEAIWLFGSTDPAVISEAVPGGPDVLITDGAKQVRWFVQGRPGQRSAFELPVVDTTGAGDAFMAGLLHGLCAYPGWTVDRRMAFASACGALVCGGAGAIDPQPTEADVLAFMQAQGV